MKKTVILLGLILFVLTTLSVYAATTKIYMEPSTDLVEKGQRFTVVIKGESEKKITALQAQLSYDKNKLSLENKTVGNDFSDLSGNDEIAVTINNKEKLDKKADFYTITFKVLDSAAEGEAKISLKNAILALVNDDNIQENTDAINTEINIKIKAKDTIENDKENNNQNNNQIINKIDTNTNSNNNSNNMISQKNSVTINKNQNMPKNITELPKAGDMEENKKITFLIIFGIVIVSYILYRKYKKY